MADFGVSATELTAPQGAGANAVAPVEQKAVNTAPMGIIGDIADVFAKGLKQNAKEEAAKVENSVMKEYSDKVSRINDALSRGAMKPSEAAARTRAIDNEYAAGYPQYIESLKKQSDFFRGKTEIGEAEDQLKRESRIREQDITEASKRGHTFFAGMGKEAEDKTIDASKYAIRAEYQFDQMRKRNEEVRAMSSEERAQRTHQISMQQEQDRQESITLLKGLGTRNFDAFISRFDKLKASTDMSFEQKAAMIQGDLMNIRAAATQMSVANPSLGAAYTKVFEDAATIQMKLLDPKNQAEDVAAKLKAEYDAKVTQAKLLAISDNRVLDYVVKDNLVKDPTLVPLTMSGQTKEWLLETSFANSEGGVRKFVKPIFGEPHEKEAYKALSTAVDNIKAGKGVNNEAALQQTVSSVNHIMQDTAKYGKEIPVKQLKDATAFFASSQFGKLAKENKLDKEAMDSAHSLLKMQWEPQVKQAILDRLDSEIPNGRDGKMKLADQVAINFNGDRVSFGSNSTNASGFDLAKQARQRGELTKAEEGLNQLIHIGAHLEGHTDYKKFWEANKHVLLPGYFMQGLEPGKEVNGYKFLGGDARNQKNYVKVKDDTAK